MDTSREPQSTVREQKDASSETRSRNPLHGLFVRAGFGLIYAGLFIACLLMGTLTTALFVAAMSWLCCFEFYRMMRLDGKVPNELLGLAAAVLFPLSALVHPLWLTALIFLLVLSLGLWYVYSPRTRIADVAVTAFGPIYTGFMMSAIVLLREAIPGFPGALLTVGVCASLWVSDSFAYLVGSRIGKHKMAPKISPNKSWEGFFGGLVGSAIIWCILWATGLYDLDLVLAIGISLAVAILGVFGDLIESRIKRGVGVKDSGNLIPGHGGMLDRSDSLIFGCITAYLLLMIGGVL
ncbi:phosphatidate cytidylyltransferase [Collinsella tanakaei]|uniref:phosphatidate cytidylyltransferase n=1 Tax=Collinsella tanakaei TaxID=626935 RepID=UPI00195BB712|nr:phosphatidate cytidylyltransferase [Collinsella tanakaei]MBM6867543.1 phosphatidate cytidylyltransferase [Collinsella tanakaei]